MNILTFTTSSLHRINTSFILRDIFMYFRYGRSQVYPIAGARAITILSYYMPNNNIPSSYHTSQQLFKFNPDFLLFLFFSRIFLGCKKEEQNKEEEIKYEPLEYGFFFFLFPSSIFCCAICRFTGTLIK